MIYQICYVIVSIRTNDRVHFWTYLLNHNNSLSHQTWPNDRYKQEQQFSGIVWKIWRTGDKFQDFFNLATCSNYSINNYDKIPVFHYFEKVNKGRLKMLNVNYEKWPDFAICRFNKIIKRPGTSFQFPALNQKYIRNVCHTAH